MYKEHLIQNLEREYVLLKRMLPLVQEKDLNYKPHDKVRTTLELLQYLSSVGSTMIRWLHKNDLTPEIWTEIREARKLVSLENISERIDSELTLLKTYMSEISEEELFTKQAILPWKEEMPLGAAIMNCPVKWLAVYRMELFLYLKLTGQEEISTKEAWVVS